MDIGSLIYFFQAHSGEIWMQVLIIVSAIGALLKGIEAIISIIAPLTPWKWDNDLADLLGKLLASKIFRKKQ